MPVTLVTLIGYALIAQVSPLDEAKRLEQAGPIAPAIEILEASLEEYPDDIEAGSYLAWLYGKAGRPDAAIVAIRISPSSRSRHTTRRSPTTMCGARAHR